MATFPSITPSYTIVKNSSPKVRVTKLGDGYEYRALYGLPLSQDPKEYNLKFENITEEESDVIEAFLRSRVADQASFTFTPPAEGFSAKTGTFVQSDGSGNAGTLITVTFANHGVAIGDVLTIDFSSGPTDGSYVVVTAADANTFTLTSSTADSALVTVATNVDFSLSGAGQYVCDRWKKNIKFSGRATITTTFREVFEP